MFSRHMVRKKRKKKIEAESRTSLIGFSIVFKLTFFVVFIRFDIQNTVFSGYDLPEFVSSSVL